MAWAVARTSAEVSTPGTSGRVTAAERTCSVVMRRPLAVGRSAVPLRRRRRSGAGRHPFLLVQRLAKVQNEALADERRQHPVGQPGGARTLHDVPHQQAVVGGDQRVGVVVRADQAAQPPVGRVQAVGVVARRRGPVPSSARRRRQAGATVDPHVAPGLVVVGVGEQPVDHLGTAAGHGHGHGPAGTQHPGQLGHGGDVVGDVLEDLRGDDPVEGAVGEGEAQGVPLDRARPGPSAASSPAPIMPAEGRPHPATSSAGPASRATTDAPRRAAAKAWRPKPQPRSSRVSPGRTPETVVVDGQHQARARARWPPARAPPGRGPSGRGPSARGAATPAAGHRPAAPDSRRRCPAP